MKDWNSSQALPGDSWQLKQKVDKMILKVGQHGSMENRPVFALDLIWDKI